MSNDYLFHYTGLENIDKILKDDGVSLMATRYGFFSDKLEYVWAKEHILPHLPSIAEQCDNVYAPEHQVHPYVASLSNLEDNLNMWRLYGNDGKGVSLVFDKALLDKFVYDRNSEVLNIVAMSVTYTDEDNILKTIADTYNKFAEEYGSVNNIADDFLSTAAFIKHKSYAMESEYRLVRFAYDGSGAKYNPEDPEPCKITDYDEMPDGIMFRTRNGEIVPYMEIKLPKKLLKGICVGYGCDFKTTQKALDLYCLTHNYDVEITKSLIK